MSKKTPVTPTPLPPEFLAVQLSPEDAHAWRAAIEAREDAVRQAEAAMLRAKLAVAETFEAQIVMVRTLGGKYGFDARKSWTLHDDNRLTPAERPS